MHLPLLLVVGGGLLIASAAAVPLAAAQQPATASRAVDVSRLGPQPGEKVPEFTLADQDGRLRSLASLMGEQGLVLVFARTADW